ncbi:MAG: NAD(P)H-dependent oxidoreductase [Flavobacterium sp.]|nr:NAD(P)H-dependent oxidoreductase [Flavobacterium sp.]
MTKKIIAFGASNSSTSINKRLAAYTTTLFKNSVVEILDLNDFAIPTYDIDIEKKEGIPRLAKNFNNKIGTADLVIISMAEHNGNYTAAFKSLFDWMSRIDVNLFQNKKMLLLSTSPGQRGASSVLEIAKYRFPRHGALVLDTFSLPNFNTNFDYENSMITNEEFKNKLIEIIKKINF